MIEKLYYKPYEAARFVGVSVAALRFWEMPESKLGIRIARLIRGHRVYTQDALIICCYIRYLAEVEGYTNWGVARQLEKRNILKTYNQL